MKSQILKAVGLFLLGGWCQAHAAIASPQVADYGDVFPGLENVSLNVNRTADDAPWFVRFNLLAPANVAIGVDGLDPFFTLTSLRITEFDDTSVNTAFGTDTFDVNPFEPDTIDQLVRANNLAPATYALAVSGFGNQNPDFVTHLRVRETPLPAALPLFVAALAGLGLMWRRTS